jgi:hypothetical protein
MEIEIIRTDFNYLISQEKMLWKNYIKVYLSIFIVLAMAGGLCLADAVDVYSKTGSFFVDIESNGLPYDADRTIVTYAFSSLVAKAIT